MNEYHDTSSRPIWNSFDGWCNVKGCNGKFSSFNEYMKHWRLLHTETTFVHPCLICLKRFNTNARTESHVTYQHSWRDAGNNTKNMQCIKKFEVKNSKYRDTYGVCPYRKSTPEERHAILEEEKERRRRMAENISEARGFLNWDYKVIYIFCYIFIYFLWTLILIYFVRVPVAEFDMKWL